jgi:hypothetical protein
MGVHQVGFARQRRVGRVIAAQDREGQPLRGLSMQVVLNDGSPGSGGSPATAR